MGQSSISMLNKVGYSMFWNSMWDNKIIYNRLLKEDMYFDKFFDLIFNDNLSINIFNLKKKSIKKFNNFYIYNKKFNLPVHKYLKSLKKITYFNSKVWILKYQNWVIFYNFVYLGKNIKNNFYKTKISYKNNFSYSIKLYNKINNSLKISNKFYNKSKIFFSF